MIFAALPWLTISINLLLVVFVFICLAMSLVILMQRPKNEGLGAAFGSGTTDQLFGARTTNVLQKATVWLATLFFLLTLTLAILINQRNRNSATLVATPVPVVTAAPAEGPVVPDPAASQSKPLEPEGGLPPVETPAPPSNTTTPPVEIPAEPTPGDPVVPPAPPENPGTPVKPGE